MDQNARETVNRHLFESLRRHADLPMQVHRGETLTYRDAARAVHGA